MSEDAGERLLRILRALPAIVGRGEVSLADIQESVGVDAPTLLDDLRALTDREDEPGGFVEAVSIFFEADHVSVFSPHFGRPARITLPELCALELGLAMRMAGATSSERPSIESARAKLRKAIVTMPETAAREDLWYAPGPPFTDNKLLQTLRSAANTSTKVQMVYRRGDSAESTERVVHPYAVLPVRGKWFLVAHCERNECLRFFRADRVQSATALPDRFTRPSEIDVQSLLDTQGRIISATTERLVVRYSSRIARWIAEREEGEYEPDGSFVASHPLAEDAWAVRHVLQYGSEAEVLEPIHVRERVATTLREMRSTDRSV